MKAIFREVDLSNGEMVYSFVQFDLPPTPLCPLNPPEGGLSKSQTLSPFRVGGNSPSGDIGAIFPASRGKHRGGWR